MVKLCPNACAANAKHAGSPMESSLVLDLFGTARLPSRLRTAIRQDTEVLQKSAPHLWRSSNMTANDKILLERILSSKKAEVAPEYSEDEYFELFTAMQVLKDSALSYDDIESGITDGGGDGGIDAIYPLVNGELVKEDTELSVYKKDVVIDIVIIQAKNTTGFSESAIEKLHSSARDIFDLEQDFDNLRATYNAQVLEGARNIKRACLELAPRFPTTRIRYYYATKATEVHPNAQRKVAILREEVKRKFHTAEFSFDFLDSTKLLQMARRQPVASLSLKLTDTPISTEGGYIGLVNLQDYNDFISNEGQLRREIFEANVRDYEGNVEVNAGIADSLNKPSAEDFWWLNNGITIISTNATERNKKLLIKDPQIVNGLQTSTEISRYFRTNPPEDKRNILVRVIVPGSDASSDRVIRATNSQTKVLPASLRATDKIHRDIEEYFLTQGLYYDRRKNIQRNAGRPISKIISIPYVAQAVAAIVYQEPHNARGKPGSLLKSDSEYKKIFNSEFHPDVFLNCVHIMKLVDQYLRSEYYTYDVQDRNNLKFHLAMYSSLMLHGRPTIKAVDVAKLAQLAMSPIFLNQCTKDVYEIYEKLGSSDQAAKRSEFAEELKKKARDQFLAKQRTEKSAKAE